jgi:hypothetical protein
MKEFLENERAKNSRERRQFNKKINEYNSYLSDIEAYVQQSQTHLQKHNHAVFDALGRTLDLGRLFTTTKGQDEGRSLLKDFLEAHNERWSSKCDVNIYHGLVSVAFNQVDANDDPINSAPTLSRYRAVLRFAFESKMDGKQLVAKLKDVTLNTLYQDAVTHFRFDPLEDYVEDDEDRFQRSIQHLGTLGGLPTAKFSEDLPKPNPVDGFATAVVKVHEDDFQVLGFVNDPSAKSDSMKAKVSALVPAEAKRRRKKLSDKKLYWLYVTCDLYSRFLPDHGSRKAWEDAAISAKLPLLDENSSQKDFDRYVERLKQQSKDRDDQKKEIDDALKTGGTASAKLKKFKFLDALEFGVKDGRWRARTITTHPNTPCIEVWPNIETPAEQGSNTIAMRGAHASKFTGDFPRFAEWSWSKENGIGTIRDETGKASSATVQDMSALALWKVEDPNLTSVARYRLDRDLLCKLEVWRDEYANIPRIGHSAFKNMMKLEADAGGLNLVHPLEKDHRKQLGFVVSGATPVFQHTRFFDFRTCETLIQLALDYGTEFEFDLMEGLEGLSAIRVYPQNFPLSGSVTLPLMLSNKGNPAEITALV